MNAKVAYRAIGLAAALVVVALLVQQLITLLLALVLTVIISLPLSAAADLAQRARAPRALGATAGLLAVFGLIALLGYFIIPSFITEAKDFADTLPRTISSAERYLHGVTGVTKQQLSKDVTSFVQKYTNDPKTLVAPLESVGLSVAGIAGGFVVVLITAMYIAINPGPLTDALLSLLPYDRRVYGEQIMSRTRVAWLRWLQATGIDMLVLGALLYAGMRIVGLQFAIGFAVFSAVMSVIPNYGSIISAVPPVLVGLAHSPGKAILVLVVYVVAHRLESRLIGPVVMVRRVNMHPALVAIGVVVMAELFGLIGVVIAIPLLSLSLILVEELWISPKERASLPTLARAPTADAG